VIDHYSGVDDTSSSFSLFTLLITGRATRVMASRVSQRRDLAKYYEIYVIRLHSKTCFTLGAIYLGHIDFTRRTTRTKWIARLEQYIAIETSAYASLRKLVQKLFYAHEKKRTVGTKQPGHSTPLLAPSHLWAHVAV
jgi:hypothetical protein